MAWRSSIRDTYSISEYGIERVGFHICFAISPERLSTMVVGQIHNEKVAHANPIAVVVHRAPCCQPPITMQHASTRLLRHSRTNPDAGNITMPGWRLPFAVSAWRNIHRRITGVKRDSQ